MEQRLFKIVAQCSASVINSGIGELVTPEPDFNHPSCGEQYPHSVAMMKESGVQWVYDNSLNKENYETLNEMDYSLSRSCSCCCGNSYGKRKTFKLPSTDYIENSNPDCDSKR